MRVLRVGLRLEEVRLLGQRLVAEFRFDVLAHYSALEQFNRAAGFSDEAEWLKARIQKIRED